MDVVCFIWDQFLIGVDCPDYQCLQHYVAVWLVLMKEKLLRCRSVRALAVIQGLSNIIPQRVHFHIPIWECIAYVRKESKDKLEKRNIDIDIKIV